MRPCLTASKSALKASLATSSGNPWFAARPGSTAFTTSAQAVSNSANDWEKDLADVLREPEVKPLLWRFVLLSDNSTPKYCNQLSRLQGLWQEQQSKVASLCRATSQKPELTSLCKLGRSASFMQQLLLAAAKSRLACAACGLLVSLTDVVCCTCLFKVCCSHLRETVP